MTENAPTEPPTIHSLMRDAISYREKQKGKAYPDPEAALATVPDEPWPFGMRERELELLDLIEEAMAYYEAMRRWPPHG